MHAWGERNQDGSTIAVSRSEILSPGADLLRKRPTGVAESYLVSVGSRTSRFRRRQRERILIVALIFLVFILLIILIVVSFYYSVEKTRRPCESRECVRSAANLLLSMDPGADPCEDFHQYACGSWSEHHPKPDSLTAYDWFTDKQQQVDRKVREVLERNSTKQDPAPLRYARHMYTACSDVETLDSLGVQPIADLLKTVGLPLIPSYFNITQDPKQPKFDWLKTVILIKRTINVDVFLGFDIFPGPKNVTLKRLAMGEPDSYDPFHTYTTEDRILQKRKHEILKKKSSEAKDEGDEGVGEEKEDKDETTFKMLYKILVLEAVKDFIKLAKNASKETFKEFSDDELKNNVDCGVDDFIKMTKLIFAISEEYSNSSANASKSIDNVEFLELSVQAMQNETDLILQTLGLPAKRVWKPYLLGLFNGSKTQVDPVTDLILLSDYDLNYLHAVVAILQGTSPLLIELNLWLQTVESLLPHTTIRLRQLFDQYSQSLRGVEGGRSRSLRCASNIGSTMGMAVGFAVAKEHPDFVNNTLPKVQRMLSNIKQGFEDLVVANNWMDRPTKTATVAKAHEMKSLIGFPPWLLQPGEIESYYLGVSAEPNAHLKNQIALLGLGFRNKLDSFRKPYLFSWETRPTEVNAYHTFMANAITVPLVMLQYPFYDLGLEALNYGSIGTVLGHELTHGFDNLGRKFDKDGSIDQWWSNITIDSFNDKSQCLVKQYSDFYVPEVGKYMDGNLTLGENIADNGGIRSALRGLRKEMERNPGVAGSLPGLGGLTQEQLFFLSYGNLWCGIRTTKSLTYDLEDVHSPSHLRLRGVLQNTPEFAAAFHCTPNSTMNPLRQRCVIF